MYGQLQAEICQDMPTRRIFLTDFGPHLNILGPTNEFLGTLCEL